MEIGGGRSLDASLQPPQQARCDSSQAWRVETVVVCVGSALCIQQLQGMEVVYPCHGHSMLTFRPYLSKYHRLQPNSIPGG